MNGWIKIHRQLLEWEHFGEPSVVTVYLTFLLSADKDGRTDINLDGVAAATKLSRGTIKKAIAILVSSGEISREKYGVKITTTITKWSEYQMGQKLDQQDDALGQKLDQQDNALGQKLTPDRVKNCTNEGSKIDPTQYYKNNKNNKNNILNGARARMREEVMEDMMVETGCRSVGITAEQYITIANEIFNDWEFQDLPDSEWTKSHFLAVMRIKANVIKRNGTNQISGQSSDTRTKLNEDAVKAMAALKAESQCPAQPTW